MRKYLAANFIVCEITQPAFTCAKIIIETLEQGVKYVQSNNKDTRTTDRRYWRRSGVFIINFEHISYLVIVFLLLTLNMTTPVGMSFTNCAKNHSKILALSCQLKVLSQH